MAKPTTNEPVADTFKTFLEELQSSLFSRFSRIPRQPEPVVYEFTHDRALLHQYYRMREVMYRKAFHTDKFSGAEDVYDKLSHILIARRGKLVVGGCRLTVREGDENFLFPMESQDFKLRNVFSSLPLDKVRHGEVSRFAVMDDDKDKMEIMQSLIRLIAEKCIDLELGFGFFKATLLVARNQRKVLHNYCGLSARICTEVKVPEMPIHPEITWYITYITKMTVMPKEGTAIDDRLIDPVKALMH